MSLLQRRITAAGITAAGIALALMTSFNIGITAWYVAVLAWGFPLLRRDGERFRDFFVRASFTDKFYDRMRGDRP